jgi:dTDP-4-dehydrorhamnose 3,5-epimerase
MRYTETTLPGVLLVDLERHEDERGFFARLWCRDELTQRGLGASLAQCSISHNHLKGTLRGMHYQVDPHPEAKFVQCIRGAIYDVALDLRRDSSTYGKWFAAELTADNRRLLYLPEGCAHGFQTLCDDSDVLYFISTPFHGDLSRGVRWDDPAYGIQWPFPVSVISARDRSYPLAHADVMPNS